MSRCGSQGDGLDAKAHSLHEVQECRAPKATPGTPSFLLGSDEAVGYLTFSGILKAIGKF